MWYIKGTSPDGINETIDECKTESEAEFYYVATGNMKDYAVVIVHILPKNNPNTFTITYTVEKCRDFSSFSSILNLIFGELKGYYPTSLTYIRTDTNTYQKE